MSEHLWLLPEIVLNVGMREGKMTFYTMLEEESPPSSSKLNSKIPTLNFYQSLFTEILACHFLILS